MVRDILIAHGVTRLWELREYGPSYEVDTAGTEFGYTGAEGFWTADGMDWLIDASHENSITMTGDWLIAELKCAWPHWERCLYTGWDQT